LKCHNDVTTHSLQPPPELTRRICDQIAKDLSRRHVPAYIFEVQDIPYNANGKKMEIQVKAVVGNGPSALTKQRLNDQERAILKQYEQFYDLEALLKGLSGGKAKL
jgi:acetoacetyl-CoA synthetase